MSDGEPTTERIDAQNDDLNQVVETVNNDEIPTANDAITSFNSQLQEKASLLSVDVENVSSVDAVEATTVPEAQSEADRLRTDLDTRETAIFDKIVTVINEGGVADVNRSEIQSPADAREIADRLEEEGGLATQAAESLRDAADLIENDLRPPLNGAADRLDSVQPATGAVEGTVTDADGEPIANATVTAGDQETTTDENGSYGLELEPGEYTLAVSADGYQDASQNVSVEADATATTDVTLQQADDGGSDEVGQVVDEVNTNEIPAANDGLTSFNSQLQEKASLLSVDVENVSSVDAVEATTVPEAQDEADRLRTDLDARETAIFDKIVTVINEGGVADVNRSEIQSPADAREVADRLEEEGGLATQAAESLRDAADLIENDLRPPLNGGADELDALEGEEPTTGTVEGTVTDESGAAVAGATVTAGDQQTTTDESGTYTLEFEPGEYTLAVSAEGYQDASQNVSVEADATTTVDVTLQQEDDGGSDEVGEVVESVNNNEIPAANDALTSFNSQLQEKASLLSVDVENVSSVDAVEAQSVPEAQDEADRLRTDLDTRETAIFDKIVTVINEGGVADVNRSEIQSPADAREVADRLEEEGGLATQAAESLRDAADLIENDLRPPLNGGADKLDALGSEEPATGTVEGTVTDADGDPISGATVTVGNETVTTAEDGTYAVDLEAGEYTLEISAEGYQDASEEVAVEAGATTTADVTLEPVPTDGTLEGTVTDTDGEPIADATVTVGDQQTTTDENGTYSLELEAGEYSLAVSADGYEDASRTVTVEVETTTTADVTVEERAGSVEGTVTDADDEPIAGASVTVGDQETTTDENGTYSLELEPGEYTLAVSAEGYVDASETVTVEAGATATADVTLEPVPTDGTLEGTVTDTDGEPIAGATVTVGDQQTTTDDNGTYSLELEAGEYTLAVSAEGYEDASEDVTVEVESTTTADVTLEERTGSVEGTVTDADDEPIADATVTAGDETVTTDENGTYTLELEPGEYTLDVSADGYETVSEDVTVDADATTTADVTLEAVDGTLEGTVTDTDGDAIADATVTVGDQETTTDENGSYSLDLEPGEYTLAVSAEGYEDASRTVSVEADATRTADVTLEPVPTDGTLEGTVSDTEGEPIADATVAVSDQQTTTDDNGTYSLELEAGEYALAVSAEGYEDASQNVSIEVETTTTADVTLEEATGAVEGTVTDADGEPVADATVTAGDETVTTGENGTYALELEPGEYTLAVSAEGYEDASQNVTVEADATTTADVTLDVEPTEGTLEGTVTDEDGDAIANATVAAGDRQTTTDDNGTYELDLEAGDYAVTVSAEGYEDASQNVTIDVDATTTLDVALQSEESDPISEAVERVNENEIAETNDELEDFNEKVDNQTSEIDEEFDDVESVEEVEASDAEEASAEADRLRADADDRQTTVFETVVAVINARAPDIVSPIVDSDDVTTPDEAREEGERIEEEYGDVSDDAALANESLHNAADLVEFTVQPNLNGAADQLDDVSQGTVEGTVTDADGEPIADATVTVGDRQTTTDENGTYSLELEPGEYTLAVSADGYEDASETVTVEAAATTTADVTLDAEPSDGTLDGTVTDADGEPIADATVSVGDQQTTTDENGSYSLELEAGEYTLTVSAEGYEDASEDVAIEADETTTVDVTLTETAPEPDADVIVDADVDEENVAVGETVTVDTDIESATDEEIEVGQYTLVMRYDSDALEFTGIDRPGWQVVDIESAGILVVDRAWVPPGQTDTPVDAFSAEFRAVDGAGEDAAFEFDARASGVEERVFLWKTQPLDAEYDGATVGIEASEDGEVEEPPSDAPEYSDEFPIVWDGLTGFSDMAGLETDATPIDDQGPVPASS
ncbi:carboxypeptidase regulatory-like domain-containing protein [Natrinema salsiterrestre]|uniref:Carboxypeptidase regulatory-like domain-containing protein n=1 Tax=Natrinema salsiterrestre TaxID=2950540 RepID=A0A9Q4KZH9_9EURY|nr:carboxypeptidase regulatory-like domain-containing protein [Natrinema salsiterrestre]MDF9745116.1 carboxypeptidase regulatory-like domain-containing protein [Natrinema salsiterrestre]